jgi:hypothetical protein
MLPKPEKIRKSSSSPEQLDLVDTLSKEKKKTNKRRFVLLFLILTVGLSFGFWAYRNIHSFLNRGGISQINFHIPKLTRPGSSAASGDYQKDIQSIIGNQNNWSIYVKTLQSNKSPFEYSQNFSEVPDINQYTQNLQKQPISQESLTQQNLPPAAKIQEMTSSQDQNFEMDSLVTIPQKQILFIIKVSGQNHDQAKNKIPYVVEKIYWQILNSN